MSTASPRFALPASRELARWAIFPASREIYPELSGAARMVRLPVALETALYPVVVRCTERSVLRAGGFALGTTLADSVSGQSALR